MIIVVSGTHASGKTSLIDAFASAHPAFEVLPDPYELLDDVDAGGGSFLAQLEAASTRLLEAEGDVIAERGPLDFVAYLEALDLLGRPERASTLVRRGLELSRAAMAVVDVLAVLPLDPRVPIHVPDDEDPALRDAMDEALLGLIEDEDLLAGATVIELSGTLEARLAQLEGVSTPGQPAG